MSEEKLLEIKNLADAILANRAKDKAVSQMQNNLQSAPEKDVQLRVFETTATIPREHHCKLIDILYAIHISLITSISDEEEQLSSILCQDCELLETE